MIVLSNKLSVLLQFLYVMNVIIDLQSKIKYMNLYFMGYILSWWVINFMVGLQTLQKILLSETRVLESHYGGFRDASIFHSIYFWIWSFVFAIIICCNNNSRRRKNVKYEFFFQQCGVIACTKDRYHAYHIRIIFRIIFHKGLNCSYYPEIFQINPEPGDSGSNSER